jgi:hypothetical protein
MPLNVWLAGAQAAPSSNAEAVHASVLCPADHKVGRLTLAGYRSLMDTIVLPRWVELPLKQVDYDRY